MLSSGLKRRCTSEVWRVEEKADQPLTNSLAGSIWADSSANGALNYVDTSGTNVNISGGLTGLVTLAGNNTFTGANTFTQPIGGATPVASTDLTTKDYVDGIISTGLLNWAQYGDTTYTASNRLTLIAGATIVLPNDALNNITSYMPSGVTFYDPATLKITPQSVGETYELRINYKGESGSVSNYLTVQLDIGGTQGVVLERIQTFPKGTGTEHAFSSSNVLFALDTFVANGGTLSITADGTAEIWDITYVIVRTAAGSIDIADAPNDGSDYVRNSGAWAAVTIPTASPQKYYMTWSGTDTITAATNFHINSGCFDGRLATRAYKLIAVSWASNAIRAAATDVAIVINGGLTVNVVRIPLGPAATGFGDAANGGLLSTTVTVAKNDLIEALNVGPQALSSIWLEFVWEEI